MQVHPQKWHRKFMWRLPRDTIPWIGRTLFFKWVWRRQAISPIDNRTRYWVYSLQKDKPKDAPDPIIVERERCAAIADSMNSTQNIGDRIRYGLGHEVSGHGSHP